MRTAAVLAALSFAACTPRARPAPTAAPTPAPATSAAAPRPVAYRPDLVAGARHTLVAAGGVVYLLDDAGRVVSRQWMPGGGRPRLAADGERVYAVADHEEGPSGLFNYEAGRFAKAASPGGHFLRRLGRDGAVYRSADRVLYRDLPRPGRFPMPLVDGLRPGVKGFHGLGDDGDWVDPLLAVEMDSGPVVAAALPARCVVADLGGGRQVVLDAPAPHQWLACGDAVVDEAGDIALLARESGHYGHPDRVVLLTVDPRTLATSRRVVLPSLPPAPGAEAPGLLVALPGGLAAYVRDRAGAYVVDLRGAAPVARRVPDLGHEAAAAGPDAIFVWGEGRTVARVAVPSGRVERVALRLPGDVSGVLRVL